MMTGVKLTGDTMQMIAAMQPELMWWTNKSMKLSQQEAYENIERTKPE